MPGNYLVNFLRMSGENPQVFPCYLMSSAVNQAFSVVKPVYHLHLILEKQLRLLSEICRCHLPNYSMYVEQSTREQRYSSEWFSVRT